MHTLTDERDGGCIGVTGVTVVDMILTTLVPAKILHTVRAQNSIYLITSLPGERDSFPDSADFLRVLLCNVLDFHQGFDAGACTVEHGMYFRLQGADNPVKGCLNVSIIKILVQAIT